jgi:hypothetical protein
MRACRKPYHAKITWFIYGFQNEIVKHIDRATQLTMIPSVYDEPFIKALPVNVLDASSAVTWTYEWTGTVIIVTDSAGRFCHPSIPFGCTF